MNCKHITLEPNELNPDGFSLTLYFEGEPTAEEVKTYLELGAAMRPPQCTLWADVNDPFFDVIEVVCPFEGHTRFQAHPTC